MKFRDANHHLTANMIRNAIRARITPPGLFRATSVGAVVTKNLSRGKTKTHGAYRETPCEIKRGSERHLSGYG